MTAINPPLWASLAIGCIFKKELAMSSFQKKLFSLTEAASMPTDNLELIFTEKGLEYLGNGLSLNETYKILLNKKISILPDDLQKFKLQFNECTTKTNEKKLEDSVSPESRHSMRRF